MKKARKARRPRASTARTVGQWSELTIAAMVIEAAPIAREIVTLGLAKSRVEEEDTHINARVERLLGFTRTDTYIPEDSAASDRALVAFDAAFAIGIATGMLLRADTFATGGVR